MDGEFSPVVDLKALNLAVVDAEDGHIVDIVTTLVEDFMDARADGRFDLAELYGLFGKLMEVGVHVMDILENPNDHFNAIVSDLEKLYDTYVVPIDFPGVGPIVEKWGKSKARLLIRPTVESMLDSIG